MKLIIDIPDEEYKTLSKMSEKEKVNELSYYEGIIANGIPLPEGHGRLIDVDALREDFKTSRKITFAELLHIACIVDHAPIIIEADKENNDGIDN